MALTAAYGSGAYTRLAEVGLGFTRTGQLELDEDILAEALQADPDAVASLFADATDGAFFAAHFGNQPAIRSRRDWSVRSSFRGVTDTKPCSTA